MPPPQVLEQVEKSETFHLELKNGKLEVGPTMSSYENKTKYSWHFHRPLSFCEIKKSHEKPTHRLLT